MRTSIVRVSGMTCDHCVKAVTDQLLRLDDVTGVSVALRAGDNSDVTVTSVGLLDLQRVSNAIHEAGYTLVQP